MSTEVEDAEGSTVSVILVSSDSTLGIFVVVNSIVLVLLPISLAI